MNAAHAEAADERSRTVQAIESEIQAIVKNIKSNSGQYPDDIGKILHFCFAECPPIIPRLNVLSHFKRVYLKKNNFRRIPMKHLRPI